MLNLNAKERMLLQDEKSHEELCIEKYNEYSEKACDPELKTLLILCQYFGHKKSNFFMLHF